MKGIFNIGSPLLPDGMDKLSLRKYVPAAWFDTIYFEGYNIGYNDAFMKQVGRTAATDMELAEIVHDEEASTNGKLTDADIKLLLHPSFFIRLHHHLALVIRLFNLPSLVIRLLHHVSVVIKLLLYQSSVSRLQHHLSIVIRLHHHLALVIKLHGCPTSVIRTESIWNTNRWKSLSQNMMTYNTRSLNGKLKLK